MDETLRDPVRFQQFTNELVIFARAQHLTLYVVGGTIRDALLGRVRTPINLDLAIASHALATAQRLASHVGGTYICLDEAAPQVTNEDLAEDVHLELGAGRRIVGIEILGASQRLDLSKLLSLKYAEVA